jgi:hypothetical protein
MKIRVISVLALSVGILALSAVPALAAPTATSAGSAYSAAAAAAGGVRGGNAGSQCGARSCSAWALAGGSAPVVTGTPVVLPPPPPCQVVPVGNATAGSQTIISFYQGSATIAQPSSTASPSSSPATTPTTALGSQDQGILSQAEQLAAENPPPAGEWYQVVPTVPADQTLCDKYPLYKWQPGTGIGALTSIGLPIPLPTVAALLYRQLTLAQVTGVTLSPQASSDTNLPTAISFTLTPGLDSPVFLTNAGRPYVVASAQANLGDATVWAKVSGMTISAGTPDATTFDTSADCVKAHPGPNGHTIMLGSRYTATQLASIGAGGSVDCGVTYQEPGTHYLTVSVDWTACWIPGLPTTVGPPKNCQPVPGAQALQASNSGQIAVNVRSITANNG